jgi:hypothetical protein
MSDPMADPRATDLLAAAPEEIHAAGVQLRLAASESVLVAQGLVAARQDPRWHGHAADSFHQAIGRLPGTLDQVHGSFAAVAAALAVYEADLNELQPAFRRVAAALRSEPEERRRAVLRRQAYGLLDEFSRSRTTCLTQIVTQTDLAPAPPASGQGTTVIE